METIVKMLFGSHLYGTDTPTSDTDLKSVHIPDANDILLQRVQGEIAGPETRQKRDGEKNAPSDVDDKSYSLQKFLGLAAEGQTVAIDMLFAPKEMIEQSEYWWLYLTGNRHRLLSRKSAAFVGYCRQQANKYGIKGSRVAAAKLASEIFLDQLSKLGAKAKVGDIPFGEIELLLDNEHVRLVQQELGSSGQLGDFIEVCNKKVSYTAPVKQAADVFARIYDQYGARARQAESNENIDWKALSHAVRVGTEAVELLSTGYVTLPLPNAEHVRDIKQAKLPYEQVSEEIEQLLVDVEEAARTSSLPDEPDQKWIDETVIEAYGDAVNEHL